MADIPISPSTASLAHGFLSGVRLTEEAQAAVAAALTAAPKDTKYPPRRLSTVAAFFKQVLEKQEASLLERKKKEGTALAELEAAQAAYDSYGGRSIDTSASLCAALARCQFALTNCKGITKDSMEEFLRVFHEACNYDELGDELIVSLKAADMPRLSKAVVALADYCKKNALFFDL